MPGPVKLLLLVIAGVASAAAQAQLLGPAFESNITLSQDDLDKMRQTVNQQIHGKPSLLLHKAVFRGFPCRGIRNLAATGHTCRVPSGSNVSNFGKSG